MQRQRTGLIAQLAGSKDINFVNISDGYYHGICFRDGLNWIPLKSWNPKTKFIGQFNTVCIHLNKKNHKEIVKNISEIVNRQKNISFNSIMNYSKEYELLDSIVSFIYVVAINFLFIKRRIIKYFLRFKASRPV